MKDERKITKGENFFIANQALGIENLTKFIAHILQLPL